MLRYILSLLSGWLCLLAPIESTLSQSDSIFRALDTITISAGRIHTPYLSVPASVSYIDLRERSSYMNHSDLSEAISGVPGVFTLNGQNYAQDLRISLRGFGARSAFGIRGIKLIVDGIPETTPDGQGQLDNIAVGDIAGIEVLQGTSAAQYGNAAGGVLEITTLGTLTAPEKSINIRMGSFGMQQYQMKTAQILGNTSIQLSAGHQRSTGYRTQSRLRQTNILAKLAHKWEKTKIDWQFSYLTSPLAEDPGGISLTNAVEHPRSARDRNILFNAGEEITHWKTSIVLEHTISPEVSWKNTLFFSSRNFDGRLPFVSGGAINLDRTYGGLLTQLQIKQIYDTWVHKTHIGLDGLMQRDDRDRYDNNDGIRGALTLDQKEKFDNIGIYLIDQWSREKWTIRGSVRYDYHRLGVDDFFVGDGDQSGSRNLSAFNYSIGLNHKWHERHAFFGTWSTSYETPTLSELTANPLGGGGFNPNIAPMSAKTLEVGGRGTWASGIDYTLSLFYIQSSDELLPYELADFPGRTFFRNAGKTKRKGLEAGLTMDIAKGFEFSSTYSFSQFTFDEYVVDGANLKGVALPGIPKHAWTNVLSYRLNHLYARVSSQYFSAISVRDDQTISVDPYHIVHLRIGGDWHQGQIGFRPFVGINNLFSAKYFDNLRLNAFGGRYYEPAATGNLQIGCEVVF